MERAWNELPPQKRRKLEATARRRMAEWNAAQKTPAHVVAGRPAYRIFADEDECTLEDEEIGSGKVGKRRRNAANAAVLPS